MYVYFVVLDEMLTGVVASQVIAPARAYAAALPGVSVRVVFLEPARVALGREARDCLRALRRLWPGGSLDLYPYVGRSGENSPAFTLRTVVGFSGGGAPLAFHCRGPRATTQAAHVARRTGGTVVFDARGATDHEAILRLASQGRAEERELLARAFAAGALLDRTGAEAADAILAVSEPLAGKVASMIEGAPKPIQVVPCCVDEPSFSASARERVRERLGVAAGEALFVHVSTSAAWEAFDEVIAFFREVRRRRAARLLFLTTLDPAVVTAALEPGDPLRDAVLVRSSPPEEVSDYLSAADVGFLLRRPHETHRYASPIKFAEYLGAGLSVVVSEGIGSTAEVTRRARVGVVVSPEPGSGEREAGALALLDHLDAGEEELRLRAIDVCRREFVWARYAPAVGKLYGATVRRRARA